MNAVRSMQQSVRFSTAPGQHRVLLRAPRVLGLTSRTAIKSKVATVEPAAPLVDDRGFQLKQDGTYDLSAPPPFSLSDIRNAIPAHCWNKNAWKSMAYLALDVAVVAGLAVAAYTVNQWWAWPFYWLAQGTMFWALFVVGHDCGHQSFSSNRSLNDFVGHLSHSSILVPYHGWRVSHRTHHGNHGHVENDESWHPVTKSQYETIDPLAKLGRLQFPATLFAYPFYLWKRSPGKEGSHYDPDCDLFVPSERKLVTTSNAFLLGMLGILGAATFKLGAAAMFNLYFMPYWVFVAWLDVVTYLHHHGSHDATEKLPWYRGEQWSYLRGGLTTLDRDYGIFNKIQHDIGTHVVHHLFPQIPHYHLEEATAAVKEVMGPYYREPEKSPGPLPVHLVDPLIRSFNNDQYVADTGDIVFYERQQTAKTA
uniref:Omega3 fatty acid desaturase n=1 Tax=Chromochloris zofingiensis TaxID=31302 RepID=A0A8F3BBE0_9CHLO|nr:Omega3 fatty acid desaturase [Chromochloris zofingiensis]|eukprot:jgi/Chrzof1/12278/Cz06g28130.t1_FAD7B[v5.2]